MFGRRARPLIALDADGVLLDFNLAYAQAWARTFGEMPRERDPEAYWPMDRWHVERLDADGRSRFRAAFGREFWATVPALPGAVDACLRLKDAGYELVCVSALERIYEAERLGNLRDCGYPIDRVVATGNEISERSPKADAIARMKPVAFVDDYLPYLRGLPSSVHAGLILRGPNGSPNTGDELTLASSTHADLADFTDYWLSRGGRVGGGDSSLPGSVSPGSGREGTA